MRFYEFEAKKLLAKQGVRLPAGATAETPEEELNRSIDLSAVGLGQQPASYVLKAGWINNVLMHCGEISCLKGLAGAKGYAV